MNKKKNRISGFTYGYADVFHNREIWKGVANEYGGQLDISTAWSYTYEMHVLTIPYKKWEIKITHSDARPLRVELLFQSNIKFKLVVSKEDFIVRIAKRFGKKDIELGHKDFDNRYLVEGDDKKLIERILTPEIQEAFLKSRVATFSLITKMPPKATRLISVIERYVAKEKELIGELVGMHKNLVDNLENNGLIA